MAGETLQEPVSAVGTTNGLNKLWNCTTPSALPPLSTWLSNMDHFLSTLQKSYFLGQFFSPPHDVATGEAERRQHVGLCFGDEWPGTIIYDGALCTSRVRKDLYDHHYVSSATTGEETPRDLSPLGHCRDCWWGWKGGEMGTDSSAWHRWWRNTHQPILSNPLQFLSWSLFIQTPEIRLRRIILGGMSALQLTAV